MANLKASFSPKEFELAIAHEETVGTATSTLTNFILIKYRFNRNAFIKSTAGFRCKTRSR